MKTKILISLAVIAVGALICLGAAGPMTFSTTHPTNNAYGVLESASWLPYKQTESLALLADTVEGGKVKVNATFSGSLTTDTNSWITGFAPGVTLPAFTAPPSVTIGGTLPAFAATPEVKPTISTNKVGGFMTFCKGELTCGVSAFSAGDVYSKPFTLTNAARVSGGSVTWQTFKLFTGDDASVDFDAFIFTQIPASLTDTNTPWRVSTADMLNYCCGHFCSTNATNPALWEDLGTNRLATGNNLAKPMQAATGTNDLFLVFRAITSTVATTNQPGVRLGFWQD